MVEAVLVGLLDGGEKGLLVVRGRNPVGENEEPKVTGEFDRCGTGAAFAGRTCSLRSVEKSQRSPRASASSQVGEGGRWAFEAHLWRLSWLALPAVVRRSHANRSPRPLPS